jgi:hypothetical protein
MLSGKFKLVVSSSNSLDSKWRENGRSDQHWQ